MDQHLALVIFAASLVGIALKAFQQLNVQHDRYLWVPPTTLMMAVCEVVSLTSIIRAGTLWAVLPLAAGGILGCWGAMAFHKYMRREHM